MRVARSVAGALVLAALVAAKPPPAVALAGSNKVVDYRGYSVVVPASWPVYELSSQPSTCVRFNRHAVYLGEPGANQRCPVGAIGRTEAILIEPRPARNAGVSGAVSLRRRGVIVTATWGRNPGVIERALGVHSLSAIESKPTSTPAPQAPAPKARPAQAPAQPGDVFTGRGFDACTAPSQGHMSRWLTSTSYRAVGVYIGGANMACSQPNLTSAWVDEVSAAGWHLIPTYVGLQAPTNLCGCAGIHPRHAGSEGTAAATEAVARAQALGLGAENPIYFDMEGYQRGGTNSSAVLAFLSAWTAQLHADGYLSGVYGSSGSGMLDLVSRRGTSFNEPDDIWIVNYNGEANTSDADVPSADFAAHQRLHQYEGGHNENHGGVTIDIDNDYLDGATAAASAAPPVVKPVPSLTVTPAANGPIRLSMSWAGADGVTGWQALGGAAPDTLAPVGPTTTGTAAAITVQSAFPFFAVQALGSAGQVLGTSDVIATPGHIAIYGKGAFVPPGGAGAVPIGCFTGNPCDVSATVSSGRTVLARTGSESIPPTGGLLRFTLSRTGRSMLSKARGRRLPVRVTALDASGATATATVNLTPFSTSGPGPQRSLTESPTLELIGLTDFVSSAGVGGVLAGCISAAPCDVTTTITAGQTTIATTGTEFLGADELGYLIFKLTPQGRTILSHAQGNQLGAQVTIADSTASATGSLALVGFR